MKKNFSVNIILATLAILIPLLAANALAACTGTNSAVFTRFLPTSCTNSTGAYRSSCTSLTQGVYPVCYQSDHCIIASASVSTCNYPNMTCHGTPGYCDCINGYVYKSETIFTEGCVNVDYCTVPPSTSSSISRFTSGQCIRADDTEVKDTCTTAGNTIESYCGTNNLCQTKELSCSVVEAGYPGAGTVIQNMHCDSATGTCVCNNGYTDSDGNKLNGCEPEVTTTTGATTTTTTTTTSTTTTSSTTATSSGSTTTTTLPSSELKLFKRDESTDFATGTVDLNIGYTNCMNSFDSKGYTNGAAIPVCAEYIVGIKNAELSSYCRSNNCFFAVYLDGKLASNISKAQTSSSGNNFCVFREQNGVPTVFALPKIYDGQETHTVRVIVYNADETTSIPSTIRYDAIMSFTLDETGHTAGCQAGEFCSWLGDSINTKFPYKCAELCGSAGVCAEHCLRPSLPPRETPGKQDEYCAATNDCWHSYTAASICYYLKACEGASALTKVCNFNTCTLKSWSVCDPSGCLEGTGNQVPCTLKKIGEACSSDAECCSAYTTYNGMYPTKTECKYVSSGMHACMSGYCAYANCQLLSGGTCSSPSGCIGGSGSTTTTIAGGTTTTIPGATTTSTPTTTTLATRCSDGTAENQCSLVQKPKKCINQDGNFILVDKCNDGCSCPVTSPICNAATGSCSECSFPRNTWDLEQHGCCSQAGQCLVNPSGDLSQNGNTSAYFSSNPPMCINNGQYILDHYCNNGNWTSRTSLIAGKLIEFAKSSVDSASNFTLFCDDYKNSVNYYEYAPVVNYFAGTCRYKNTEFPVPCINSICVLKYSTASGSKVIAGTALNWPINESSPNKYSFFSAINKSEDYCNGHLTSNDYERCLSKDVWYNGNMQSVIFGKEEFSLIPTVFESIWNFIRNPFAAIRQWLSRIGKESDADRIASTQFTKVYFAQLLNKEVAGIVNVYPDSSSYLWVSFKNFTTDFCKDANLIDPGSCSARQMCEKVIVANRSAGKENKLIELWPLMTASLRINEGGSDLCHNCMLDSGEDFVDCGGSCAPCNCHNFDFDNDNYVSNAYASVPGGCLANDCNEFDSGIHPGAADICDGIDNNCDGIDNNCPETLSITITSPAEGQLVPSSSNFEIRWIVTNPSLADKYEIYYSIDNKTTFMPVNIMYPASSCTANSCSFIWAVPVHRSKDAFIMIKAYNGSENIKSAFSGEFQITSTLDITFAITKPLAGDTFYAGEAKDITWTAEGTGMGSIFAYYLYYGTEDTIGSVEGWVRIGETTDLTAKKYLWTPTSSQVSDKAYIMVYAIDSNAVVLDYALSGKFNVIVRTLPQCSGTGLSCASTLPSASCTDVSSQYSCTAGKCYSCTGGTPVCGNGICETGETATCPSDCTAVLSNCCVGFTANAPAPSGAKSLGLITGTTLNTICPGCTNQVCCSCEVSGGCSIGDTVDTDNRAGCVAAGGRWINPRNICTLTAGACSYGSGLSSCGTKTIDTYTYTVSGSNTCSADLRVEPNSVAVYCTAGTGTACTNSGGTWKTDFPNACADNCGALTNCATVITAGCDCGTSKCWNATANACVNNSGVHTGYCGDGNCDTGETTSSCPSDCGTGGTGGTGGGSCSGGATTYLCSYYTGTCSIDDTHHGVCNTENVQVDRACGTPCSNTGCAAAGVSCPNADCVGKTKTCFYRTQPTCRYKACVYSGSATIAAWPACDDCPADVDLDCGVECAAADCAKTCSCTCAPACTGAQVCDPCDGTCGTPV